MRLIHGDCLQVLPTLEAGSVDAIVTDPPYGQTNEKYDKGVDPRVWAECFRVARPNAALLSFAGNPTYHRIASGIEAAGWRVRQMWAWVYRDGLITSAYPREGFDRLAPAMDPICFATKGKVLLNLQREGKPWKVWHERKPGDRPLSSRSDTLHAATEASGHWPRSLVSDGLPDLEYFALRRTKPDQERTNHPNQKPLALMRWLLSKLPPGGLILDPFAGSGSTGKAAIAEGFDFIGIERDAEYMAIAQKRIDAAMKEAPLFAKVEAAS